MAERLGMENLLPRFTRTGPAQTPRLLAGLLFGRPECLFCGGICFLPHPPNRKGDEEGIMSDRRIAIARAEVATAKLEAKYLCGGRKLLRDARKAERRALRRHWRLVCKSYRC